MLSKNAHNPQIKKEHCWSLYLLPCLFTRVCCTLIFVFSLLLQPSPNNNGTSTALNKILASIEKVLSSNCTVSKRQTMTMTRLFLFSFQEPRTRLRAIPGHLWARTKLETSKTRTTTTTTIRVRAASISVTTKPNEKVIKNKIKKRKNYSSKKIKKLKKLKLVLPLKCEKRNFINSTRRIW